MDFARGSLSVLTSLDIKLAEQLQYRGGYFVEAGGNDGISQSNTAYFERYLGWKGLLIEPIPDLAARCKANRPQAIVECCALVAKDFPNSVVEMHYCNLMSLVRGARGSLKPTQHMLLQAANTLDLTKSLTPSRFQLEL